jgi:phosphoribosylaminoimidazolecarboxamide formyltransferase/IMP cyclohydrolase
MSRIAVRRALLSVWDKTGLVEFARSLIEAGVELVSSGGTARALREAGLPVTAVADVTDAPEMLGGRVKTLHPKIHGAILADLGKPDHREDLYERGIAPIQLVVVNLYPFEATVAREGVTDAEAIEQIDIGGPTLIRAAAKNHAWVGVVTSPEQYGEVAAAIAGGGLDAELRSTLAHTAFFRTAAYDAAIVGWLERDAAPPARTVLALERRAELRYGENPHQAGAAFGQVGATPWWETMRQLQGKEMSFNNYLDTEAAWRMVHEFPEPAVAIIKHANPCGLAVAATLADAFTAAWDCDPLSAYGSVIACGRPLDGETAQRIAAAGFVEVVIAAEVTPAAAEALAGKKNLRLLEAAPPDPADPDMRRIEAGFVVQQRDRVEAHSDDWEVVSSRRPSPAEWADLEFALKVVTHTKSNAVVVAKDGAAVGVGAGDQSRVGAAERALHRAGDRAQGAVAASDAFLPFRDGLDTLAAAGVVAVIEPGGSVRDEEVVAAAEEHGVALVFTGRRHFRH